MTFPRIRLACLLGPASWILAGCLVVDTGDGSRWGDTGRDVVGDDTGTAVGTDTGRDAGPDGGDRDGEADTAPAAGDADAVDGGRPVPLRTLTELYDDVLQPRCSPCHTTRVSGGLSLARRETLSAQLLASSVQQPAMRRVRPGDPDGSYLWRKLTGDHLAVGGLGEPMPLGVPLASSDLLAIRRWIEAGAVDDLGITPETARE
jgi:hypothetical protein